MNALIKDRLHGITSYFSNGSKRVSLDSVSLINQQVDDLQTLTDANLLAIAQKLRSRVRSHDACDDDETIKLGFSLAVEAIRRALGMRLYDVQILGGLVMANGCIAEMQTGEGKTLTVAPVAFTHSLYGKGVHVATTNAYLAERDYEELRDAFTLIGATSGLLDEEGDPEASRAAYRADITYGTGYQYGFDYLRDQITISSAPKLRLGQEVIDQLEGRSRQELQFLQRGHGFAIIDEIDSVLIDEAGTPLILSGSKSRGENPLAYSHAQYVVSILEQGHDYTIDKQTRKIDILPSGFETISSNQDPAIELNRPWIKYIRNAIFASHCVERDVDYIVADSKVQIVDQNTGRIFDDRTWRDGMHQAVEAKEGLEITEGKASLAKLTRQRYFKPYHQICGLTGTATGNEVEFRKFYGLEIQVIPQRLGNSRKSLPTRFFTNNESKLDALIEETKRIHATGQPILIGTRTIQVSTEISYRLAKHQIDHVVLNGVQDEAESTIVARAGALSSITVATNMAGRGTDIKIPPECKELGGLHVIGSEQNFSARVDRQLVGRSARGGDPGSCQFFVSAEDELILQSSSLAQKMARARHQQGECLQDFTQDVHLLQDELERKGFENRKQMVQHDNWIDTVLESLNKEAS